MTIKIDALLLSAGTGSRLQPYTKSTPKCLMPILGRPLMDYWIDTLTAIPNLNKIYVNTSYLSEMVEEYIRLHNKSKLLETVYEPVLLGTAGSLKKLANTFIGQNILVAHADNLSKFDIQAFLTAHLHRPKCCSITMMTFDTDDPKSCGIVKTNKDGVVTHYFEKPQHDVLGDANAAVYFFAKDAVDEIKRMRSASDLSTDVLPNFLGRIFVWKNNCYHRDIGNPIAYGLAQTEYKLKFFKKLG